MIARVIEFHGDADLVHSSSAKLFGLVMILLGVGLAGVLGDDQTDCVLRFHFIDHKANAGYRRTEFVGYMSTNSVLCLSRVTQVTAKVGTVILTAVDGKPTEIPTPFLWVSLQTDDLHRLEEFVQTNSPASVAVFVGEQLVGTSYVPLLFKEGRLRLPVEWNYSRLMESLDELGRLGIKTNWAIADYPYRPKDKRR